MQERLVDAWLDEAGERGFQIPFCHMLQRKGHTVLHLTRHWGMEMGKDVISIDPDGNTCVFQLKSCPGPRITQSQWDREIFPEILKLTTLAVIHPAVDPNAKRLAFLVTNRNLDEAVSRAIDDFNRTYDDRFKLDAIVGGQLHAWAVELSTDLWPNEMSNVKLLLQLFIADGKANLNKLQLSELLEHVTKLDDAEVTSIEALRRVYSSSIATSLATAQFERHQNYYALIEAWTMQLAYGLALCEKAGVESEDITKYIDLVTKVIINYLENLCDELKDRRDFFEGDFVSDKRFIDARLTIVAGLMSVLGLHRRLSREPKADTDNFLEAFVQKRAFKNLYLWGESAVPLILSVFWFLRKFDASLATDSLLGHVLTQICAQNRLRSRNPLFNPYYNSDDVLAFLAKPHPKNPPETFQGHSYTVEALMHLFARRLWKQGVRFIWPDYTRITSERIEESAPWKMYRWLNNDSIQLSVMPKITKDWTELLIESDEREGRSVPESLKSYPVLFILFLCVYPHRFTSDRVRWLDRTISELA